MSKIKKINRCIILLTSRKGTTSSKYLSKNIFSEINTHYFDFQEMKCLPRKETYIFGENIVDKVFSTV